VPGRTDKSESPPKRARADGLNALQDASRCKQGGPIAFRGHDSIGVQVCRGVAGSALDVLEQAGVVNELEFVQVSTARLNSFPALGRTEIVDRLSDGG
jgi:hypothetical protein